MHFQASNLTRTLSLHVLGWHRCPCSVVDVRTMSLTADSDYDAFAFPTSSKSQHCTKSLSREAGKPKNHDQELNV